MTGSSDLTDAWLNSAIEDSRNYAVWDGGKAQWCSNPCFSEAGSSEDDENVSKSNKRLPNSRCVFVAPRA